MIVVDADLAPEIESLASTSAVWAVRAPQTEAVARRVWGAAPPKAPRQAQDGSLTLFSPDGPPAESVLSILDTVELHHGEHGQSPPVSVIEVFGTTATAAIEQALAMLGFAEVDSSAHGFSAHRTRE